ncbi:lysophospholipid acyltransferase family protein [Adhaeretor mobilis]|uniref:2-acyl-glycerophospho-ethanolamine acyltransferase n=1 Tax=Adhaeretor mobilis TaxID=1930276 RepID=A0A517MYD1_9BACT|nr:lysophospholipid acyltransferase family protein [Adhaeretor mobilis]QDS99891.1 2-acyl-glycerophospho-ethanolamine acyltransferase [Adhaeretor mobilis]
MPSLEFHNGEYHSPRRKVSWFARRFPSLVFYTKFFWIVVKASSRAKFATYDSTAWSDSSVEVIRALESVGMQFEVTGREHIESVDGPCLIVGNHQSSLETTVLPAVIQPIKEVTFVVKQALLDYPIFKHVMRSRDPIAVTQSDPRGDFKRMLGGAQERIQRGSSIVIFPEGVRAEEFNAQRFNTIGVKVAQRNDVPIVPLALDTWAWPLGERISEVGRLDPSRKVRFAFGAPLTVSGRGDEEQQLLVNFIERKRSEWRRDESSLDSESTLPTFATS